MNRSWKDTAPPVRMNVRRLSIIFALSTVVPLVLSVLVIALFDLSVTVLLWVSVASIPLAAFTVGRAVLAEMDRVIQIVAPDEPEALAANNTEIAFDEPPGCLKCDPIRPKFESRPIRIVH